MSPVSGAPESHPYISAFVSSACDVLQTMAMQVVECREIRPLPDAGVSCETGGGMELSGDVTGRVALAMNGALARAVVGGMLGKVSGELSADELRDGVLELVNMTAGGAKTRLSETLWRFALSVPHDLSGTVLTPNLFPGHDAAEAIIACGDDQFSIVVSLVAPRGGKEVL